MQKKSSKKLEFLNNLLNDGEVLDVILFGSSVKGKLFPKDTDAIVLIPSKIEKQRVIAQLPHDMINSTLILTYDEFLKNRDLIQTAVVEGVSLKANGRVSELISFESRAFFFFRITLKGSKRVRFYRALKLVLNETLSVQITAGCIYSPVSEASRVEEFFSGWRIPYVFVETLIPHRFAEVLGGFVEDGMKKTDALL